MDLTELYGKLQSLAAALRTRDWLAGAQLMGDFLVAYRQARDAGEVTTQPALMSCPCNPDDLDACADWCEAQVKQAQTVAGPAGVTAFPWAALLPIIQTLLEKLLKN
mgnify:CR=1 FL=1